MSQSIDFYNQNGYVVVKNVFRPENCSQLISQILKLKKKSKFNEIIKQQTEGQDSKTHSNSSYFVDEHNKASYFFENVDPNYPELKQDSMIKIGHCLHLNEIFRQAMIYPQLGINNPLILQSMTLQKLSMSGGKVTIHQDSTFLYAQPDTVTGFWVPLQDVNQNNGCIWGIPGSHKNKLYFRYRVVAGKVIYDVNGPVDFKEEDCVPIPMQKGDLLIMNGKFLHKSHDNLSGKSRHVFTWHVMDKESKWADDNWLSIDQINKNQ